MSVGHFDFYSFQLIFWPSATYSRVNKVVKLYLVKKRNHRERMSGEQVEGKAVSQDTFAPFKVLI